MIDYIGYVFLLVEATLVDSAFGEIRLDDVQPTEMPSACTIITETLVVVAEIVTCEPTSCLAKVFGLPLTDRMVMLAAFRLKHSRVG